MILIFIATSKQRSKYRKAVAENKKKVIKLIETYNKIISNSNVTNEVEVSEEDVISGCFPWSALTGKCNEV